jgi:hypothetical protein
LCFPDNFFNPKPSAARSYACFLTPKLELLNISLVIAIALSTVYSVTGEKSQVFSIILMAVVLLVVNSKYLLAVRNK